MEVYPPARPVLQFDLQAAPPPGRELIGIDLDIQGRRFRARIETPVDAISLADIVPVARQLASAMAIACRKRIEESGRSVPCRRGCSACCRYLIPLSAPEAVCLWGEVASLPRPKRDAVMSRHLDCARRVLDSQHGRADAPAGQALGDVSRWYARLGMDCPFLSGNLCSTYSTRPIACREHMANSSPSQCRLAGRGHGSPVQLPYSVLEALGQLAAQLQPDWPRAILLPLALAWAGDPHRQPAATWPAPTLFGLLADILRRQHATDRAGGDASAA